MTAKDRYQEYLATDHWRNLKEQVALLYGKRCHSCGEADHVLHGHHVCYRELYDCKPEDIMLLCPDCHDTLHKAMDCYHEKPFDRHESLWLIRKYWGQHQGYIQPVPTRKERPRKRLKIRKAINRAINPLKSGLCSKDTMARVIQDLTNLMAQMQ